MFIAAARITRSLSCCQITLAADFKVDSLVEPGIRASWNTTAEEATDCMVGGYLDGLLCSKGRGYMH